MLELDEYLVNNLRKAFPRARVINADAIERLPELSFDVLLSNLPYTLTDQVIEILKRKKFRCAILAIKIDHNIDIYRSVFEIDELVVLDKHDFIPAQNYQSRLIQLVPIKGSV